MTDPAESRDPRARRAAVVFASAIVIAALAVLVAQGGRPAIAAGDCEYGQCEPYLAQPTLTTTPVPAATHVGIYLQDTATLAGGDQPTGTLTFRLYAPGDEQCLSAVAVQDVEVNGNGSYASRPENGPDPIFTTTTAVLVGTYRWTVAYSGDGRNAPAMSGCASEPVTVSKLQPVSWFFLAPLVAEARVGDALDITANLFLWGYNPEGELRTRLFGPADPECTGAATFEARFDIKPNALWSYLYTLSEARETTGSRIATVAGTWRWQAEYTGDWAHEGFVTSCGAATATVTAVSASPTLSTTPVPNRAVRGRLLRDTARLVGGREPTGTITFRLFGPNDPACSGTPRHVESVEVDGGAAETVGYIVPIKKSQVGTWNWTATYGGDRNNEAAESPCGAEPVVIYKR